MMIRTILFCTLYASHVVPNFYTIYAHGIMDKPSQIKRFSEAIVTNQNHTLCVTFPDTQKETGYGINRLISECTTYHKKPMNRSKMHMAGPEDIEALHATIQNVPQNSEIILFGCSRGAATIINELGLHNPSNIAAVILDASPANMPETLHPILAGIGVHQSYDKSIFSTLFPAYSQESISPLEAIKKIQNKQLPILLIHAQNDTKVPYNHALQLYKKLRNHGFTDIYLATIPQGRHAFLLQDQQAKDCYLQAVHSFYKKYKLPYNEQYAQNDMTQYQPTLAQVEEKILIAQEALQKQYEQSRLRNLLGISLLSAMLISYLLYKKLDK